MTYLSEADHRLLRDEIAMFGNSRGRYTYPELADHVAKYAVEQIVARVAAEAEAKALETAERAIEAARDKLHPAFGEGDANLPRGYSNAAHIVRDLRAEAGR